MSQEVLLQVDGMSNLVSIDFVAHRAKAARFVRTIIAATLRALGSSTLAPSLHWLARQPFLLGMPCHVVLGCQRRQIVGSVVAFVLVLMNMGLAVEHDSISLLNHNPVFQAILLSNPDVHISSTPIDVPATLPRWAVFSCSLAGLLFIAAFSGAHGLGFLARRELITSNGCWQIKHATGTRSGYGLAIPNHLASPLLLKSRGMNRWR